MRIQLLACYDTQIRAPWGHNHQPTDKRIWQSQN